MIHLPNLTGKVSRVIVEIIELPPVDKCRADHGFNNSYTGMQALEYDSSRANFAFGFWPESTVGPGLSRRRREG